jgi:hypothetical protein
MRVRAAFKRSRFADVRDVEPRAADSIAQSWLETFDSIAKKWEA